LHSQNLSKIE